MIRVHFYSTNKKYIFSHKLCHTQLANCWIFDFLEGKTNRFFNISVPYIIHVFCS